MANVRICITPRLLLSSLLVSFGLLLALHLLTLVVRFGFDHDYVLGLIPMFYFGDERNIPTMYTVLLFVLASLQCLLAAKVEHRAAGKWVLLGFVFIMLAVDEFVGIHEEFIRPVRDALSTSGFFYFAWIIPYFVIVAVLFLILLGWLRNLPKDLRAGLLVSAATYLSGVFLMEGIGGWYYGGVPERFDLVYLLIVSLEESLEILGLTIFIYFVAKYLASSFDHLQIDFAENQ